jgi:uncharacterized protein YqjF (DUF2071 family)
LKREWWSARRQAHVLGERDHRPWPLPSRPWVMGQTWEDLLFAHWPVEERALRRIVPDVLPLDSFDGRCWIGITPFRVTGLRPRLLPPPPLVSSFPEVNVRTYVSVGGKPGIWFLSLDAASRLAVRAARRGYRIPYFTARMRVERRHGTVHYESERVARDGPPAALAVEYASTGRASPPRSGTFEQWAAERYCLYTVDEHGRVLRADIHHPPWPLEPARAEFARNTMAEPYGLELPGEPLTHLARRQDVVFWPLGRGD